ncbi:MAG TPA: cytochrome c [Bacteroidia bacterium]|nr:cytochrome c [Bacteroidia bacterium]
MSNFLNRAFSIRSRWILFGSLLFSLGVLQACSGGETKESPASESTEASSDGNLMADAENMKDDGKGIGPVTSVEVGAAVDAAMASEGEKLFEAKCTACHKVTDEKYVGPGLKGVTQRRKPEWIMNMILNPTEMTQKDPAAKELLATHLTQMTNQNVTQEDARKLLEYLRKIDG